MLYTPCYALQPFTAKNSLITAKCKKYINLNSLRVTNWLLSLCCLLLLRILGMQIKGLETYMIFNGLIKAYKRVCIYAVNGKKITKKILIKTKQTQVLKWVLPLDECNSFHKMFFFYKKCMCKWRSRCNSSALISKYAIPLPHV